MSKGIQVCIITTAHPVDDVRVNYKFAHAFCEAGYRVIWVGPGHAFFDWENYKHDNIQFFLAPAIRNRIDRLLAASRVHKLAAPMGVDVYYSPDPDAAAVALNLAKKNGAKVIFDIHEVFHGAILDRWLLDRRLYPIRNYIQQRIKRICSKCDLVLGVSNAVLDPYLTHKDRYMVVRSCAPSWFANSKAADILDATKSPFKIVHGKSDLMHGTKQVIEAAAISKTHGIDLRIVMFKSSKNNMDIDTRALISESHKLGISEIIDMQESIPFQKMPDILQACDAGMVAYGRDLGIDSLPNRLFEYMAAGLAIIAPFYAREIARIIETERCGILVDFEDPRDIAKAIIQLRRNPHLCREMGKRAREAFLLRYNWEKEVRPVIDYIQKWQNERINEPGN